MDYEFQKILPSLSADYQANGNKLTKYSLRAILHFNIPGDCVLAIWALLENPELIKDEKYLQRLIQPPVKYISFRAKKRGPSDAPEENYLHWQQDRADLFNISGKDLLEQDEGLILQVSAYATKGDILSFINGHFDEHLKPLLTGGEGTFTPESIRKERVIEPSKLKARVLALHRQGKSPKEIEAALGSHHWSSNISKIISESKHSRKN